MFPNERKTGTDKAGVKVSSCGCGVAVYHLHHINEEDEPFLYVLYIPADKSDDGTVQVHIAQNEDDFREMAGEKLPDHVHEPDDLLDEEEITDAIKVMLETLYRSVPEALAFLKQRSLTTAETEQVDEYIEELRKRNEPPDLANLDSMLEGVDVDLGDAPA